MVIAVSVKTNADSVIKGISNIRKKHIPAAQFQAVRSAAVAGRREAIRTGKMALDNPIPAIFNERKGWIWIDYTRERDIKQGRKANAKVWIRGRGSDPKELTAQQEIAHRQIKGKKVTNVPISIPYIIRPSKRLRRSKIIGVPLRMDRHGNIKGNKKNYVDTITDMVKNPKYKGQFFEVRIGQSVRSGQKKLPPGLYQRVLYNPRTSDYVRHASTGNRRGPYKTRNSERQKTRAKFLITILSYHRIRDYKQRWNYKPPVIERMQKVYSKVFLKELDKMIAAERRKGFALGPRTTGVLSF